MTSFGFVDGRSVAELLSSDRPPKKLKYTIKNPIPPKLRGLRAKIGSAVGSVTNQVGSKLGGGLVGSIAMGATKMATAAVAQKVLGSIAGKAAGPAMKIQQATNMLSLGVNITEEFSIPKLRRPLIEGPAIDPHQLGKQLVQTTSLGIIGAMIAGAPIASGLPPQIKVFTDLKSVKASHRYIGPTGGSTTGNTAVLVPTSIQLYPQNGLLEDEIMYRLVLLAENVYEPIAAHVSKSSLPRLEILECMRSENSRVSAHERGEAIDLTLVGGSNRQLYDLAVWIKDNIIYDQLILCHSNIRGGQVWIHISFSPTGNRRQVFTKNFADEFAVGLHIYAAYTDPANLAKDKADAKARSSVSEDMVQRLAARDSRLAPVGVNTPEQLVGPMTSSIAIPGVGPGGGIAPPPGGTKAAEYTPYVGNPGGSCSLPAMAHNTNFYTEVPSFMDQVSEAQNDVYLAHGTDPAWFNNDGSCVDGTAYCVAVAAVLASKGFCAENVPGSDDEVAVKVTNEWNDHYDIVIGGSNQPHTMYVGTHRPARF